MWVYLNDAFLSIVAHKEFPDALLVRARRGDDIVVVFAPYDPDLYVTEGEGTDYRFRATLPRAIVARALANRAFNIDYTNFKNSVEEDDRHDVYLRVWTDTQTLDPAKREKGEGLNRYGLGRGWEGLEDAE